MPVVIDDHLPIDEQLAAVIGADEEPPQVVHSEIGGFIHKTSPYLSVDGRQDCWNKVAACIYTALWVL